MAQRGRSNSLIHLFAILSVLFTFGTVYITASPTPIPATSNSQLIQALARQAIDPICYDPPRDTCSFYATCVEPRYNCGPDGYPIGYGKTFCQKFSDERNELDTKGVTWMLDVMQCLQRVLIPEATGAPDAKQTCVALKTKALGSHPKCYVDNGLCTLGPRDWAAILDIVGIPTLLKDRDLPDYLAVRSGLFGGVCVLFGTLDTIDHLVLGIASYVVNVN